MKDVLKKAIEEYQCSGCFVGSDISCYKKSTLGGSGCGKHCAGTIIMPLIGTVLLGLPTGFNRLGNSKDLKPNIFEKWEDGWGYNIFNVPVWKYLDKNGNTLVRGISPRLNAPFIHIFIGNHIEKIDCLEITNENLNEMD